MGASLEGEESRAPSGRHEARASRGRNSGEGSRVAAPPPSTLDGHLYRLMAEKRMQRLVDKSRRRVRAHFGIEYIFSFEIEDGLEACKTKWRQPGTTRDTITASAVP